MWTQRHVTADTQTELTNLGCQPTARLPSLSTSTIAILLLLSSKADTHFTILRKASDILTSTLAAFLFSSHGKRERDRETHLNYYASADNRERQPSHHTTKLNNNNNTNHHSS